MSRKHKTARKSQMKTNETVDMLKIKKKSHLDLESYSMQIKEAAVQRRGHRIHCSQ